MAKVSKRQVVATAGLSAFGTMLDKALVLVEKNPDAFEGMHARQGNPITLGPRVPEAADWAEKQTTNAAAAGDRWLKGVLAPKKNPIDEAKKKKGKYRQKMEQALREDRYGKGLDLIDEDEMYATIRDGGSAPFSSGVTRRRAKVERVAATLRPMVVALTATLDAMPVDTPEQREAKMIAAKRGMEAIGKKRRGIS